ncbi:hypothetical protein [Oceaniglobus roseus]|uniref:hypothetical protein n=1 Tax=Oceaniglobus roseus TaxID=1737570 RepID=UPI000C7ED30C|nr:hypothetical protein [Kandeliimicrobium roseum]
MRRIALVLMLWPVAAAAHDWTPLTGGEIADLLSGHGVVFDGVRQRFDGSGATVLEVSPPRRGKWRVRGDAYCTVIPPLTSWTCYRVESVHGEMVRFTGPGGASVEGVVIP